MSSEDHNSSGGGPDSQGQSLPPGYPERPDIKKVRKLQEQLAKAKSQHRQRQLKSNIALRTRTGKQVKDIGTYTLIPMMMLAGPMVGFGLGYLVQRQWGGDPWPGVIGLLFGLVAAFRQIFILLAKKETPKK